MTNQKNLLTYAYIDSGAYDRVDDENAVEIYGEACLNAPDVDTFRFTLTLSRTAAPFITVSDDDAAAAGIGLGMETAAAAVIRELESTPRGLIGNRYALDRWTIDNYLPARWQWEGHVFTTASGLCGRVEKGADGFAVEIGDNRAPWQVLIIAGGSNPENLAANLISSDFPDETAYAIAELIKGAPLDTSLL